VRSPKKNTKKTRRRETKLTEGPRQGKMVHEWRGGRPDRKEQLRHQRDQKWVGRGDHGKSKQGERWKNRGSELVRQNQHKAQGNVSRY